MRSNLVDLSVYIHHETDKALLVSDNGNRDQAVWLPKSVVEIEGDYQVPSVIEITLPEYIAEERGLI